MSKEDHDLLIELKTAFDAKMGTLCNTITELKTDIKDLKNNQHPKEQLEKCDSKFEKINDRIEKRPKWSQITTIIIILIGILSGIIGYNFNRDAKASDEIKNVHEQVMKNQGKINIIGK
jgi:hypothetical protein